MKIRQQVVIAKLPVLTLRPNWQVPTVKMPQLLVKGLSPKLDQVGERLANAILSQEMGGMSVGLAEDCPDVPNQNRTLRLIRSLQTDHQVMTDVTLRAQGGDLYVRFKGHARSRIAWLRGGLLVFTFLALVIVGYSVYFNNSNAYRAMAQEYARKYSSNPMIGMGAIIGGVSVDSVTGQITHARPWTLMDFLRQDPKLFLTTLGLTPAMIVGAVIILLRLAPPNFLRHPCLWLGWPTPDDLQNASVAHFGWVHAKFGETMLKEFGITRDQIVELPT